MNEQTSPSTEKIDSLISQLKTLTLWEASALVTEIEKTFGVDTSMIVSGGGGSSVPAPAAAVVDAVEEQTSFTLTLTDVPADKKIAILKVVRNVTGLGLKESKDIVDNVPKLIKEGLSKEESEKAKKEFEEAGAKITLK
jgi:large subunit ribosomal protein L7/L12